MTKSGDSKKTLFARMQELGTNWLWSDYSREGQREKKRLKDHLLYKCVMSKFVPSPLIPKALTDGSPETS